MQILQTILLYIVPFVLVLGIVVTVHELGHYLAAKWLGTKIDRFSIGFGRAIAHCGNRVVAAVLRAALAGRIVALAE